MPSRQNEGTANFPYQTLLVSFHLQYRNVYSDVIYKLNEDFVIGLVEGAKKKPKSLKVGMNEIVTGKAIAKYDVKEVYTTNNGMCFTIIPNEIFMTPYVDYLTILVSKRDKMDELIVQISSNDTFHTTYATAPAMNNEMISIDFDIRNKGDGLTIEYTEENTEYINECSEMAFFKCYATTIAESEEFKCPKKCVSLIYQAIMDTIAHNIPRCETDAENYCMVGTESMKPIGKLKSTCRKQCNYKGSN